MMEDDKRMEEDSENAGGENDKLLNESEVNANEPKETESVQNNENKRSESKKDEEDFKKPTLLNRLPTKNKYKSLLKQKLLAQQNGKPGENATGPQESETADNNKENNSGKSKITFPLPYEEPSWKGIPESRYYIEELKLGTIERTIEIKEKSFISFGRVENCDIDMAHPTVSRFHAVLQYRGEPDEENSKGYYLYDLGSTHGTFLNKYRIKPKIYVPIKVGHMFKIGCSSRLFLLQGPSADEEEESELSLTELKVQRQAVLDERKRKEEEELRLEQQEKERQEKLLEERGISWGMAEDADEETDLTENPYAVMTNEELYVDDPKKALRMWYEREGEELHYQTEKAEKGMFICKLMLPIDDGDGREIVIETSSRSKKESQVQCALEACRTIDKMGLLRPAKRESKKVQKRNWEENDYYDSDEDSFLDRTGDLDKKREKRMRKAGKIQETVETYDSLMEKHAATAKKIQRAERKLNELTSKSSSKPKVQSDDDDALDVYMISLKYSQPNKIEIKIAKDELHLLQEEEVRLRKLINIAKPANMPELIKPVPAPAEKTEESSPTTHPMSQPSKNVASPAKDRRPELNDNSPVEIETKKPKLIGPTLPTNLKLISNTEKTKKIKKNQKSQDNKEGDYHEDYNAMWQPPPGQTGDGRTALNDKYGY